jgi:hypothetical protein
MANITVFDSTRGDVTLTAAVLTRIRNGQLTLTLLGDRGDVRIDATLAEAIVAGTASLSVVAQHHGKRSLNKDSLAALT